MKDAEMADQLERRVTWLLLEIEKTEVRLQQLKTDLARVRNAIAAFDPSRNPPSYVKLPKHKKIARRGERMPGLFGEAEYVRRTCDILRGAPEPLTVTAIARKMIIAKGISGLSEQRMQDVKDGIERVLYRLRDRGEAEREGNREHGGEGLWWIKS